MPPCSNGYPSCRHPWTCCWGGDARSSTTACLGSDTTCGAGNITSAGAGATGTLAGGHRAVAAQAQRRAEEIQAQAEAARLTRAEVQQGLETRRTEEARQQFLQQPAHRFEEAFVNRDFAQNYPRIEGLFNRQLEEARRVRDENSYNAMGNLMTSMQLMQQTGQLVKTVQGMDSLDKNSPTASGGQLPQANPSLVGVPRSNTGIAGNLGANSAGTASTALKDTRPGSTVSEGTDFAPVSGSVSEESKFMAGILDGKDLDKALGIKTSLVPPGFLENLDKKLAGIQNEKELVDLLKQAGVDANIASLAGIKSLSEFGAIAGKAIEAKTMEEGASYSASGGASRSQGSAEDELNPNDILLKLTEGMGRMGQVQDDSPKAKDFKGTREMLASNLDARLKLARKEAGSAKIAVNANAPDSRNPAQANCLPGENCAAQGKAADSSNGLMNFLVLGIGLAISFGVFAWLRRNKNKTPS